MNFEENMTVDRIEYKYPDFSKYKGFSKISVCPVCCYYGPKKALFFTDHFDEVRELCKHLPIYRTSYYLISFYKDEQYLGDETCYHVNWNGIKELYARLHP